jgi:uncharacterized membrane protein YkoI
MTRRHLIVLLSATLAFVAVEAGCPMATFAKDGGSGGGGDGGGRGGGDGGRGGGDNSGRGGDDSGSDRGSNGGGQGRGHGGDDDAGRGRGRGRGDDDRPTPRGWGSTTSENAREAVSQCRALALSAVLPTVSRAVPGQVLEVDLRQTWGGEWRYEFLILTRDRRYQEVVVDARNNQILQIRRR